MSGALAFAAADLYVASLPVDFFEAGWSVQVLVGDAGREQYEASRLTRPAAERHLRTMADSAAALPLALRERMPKVDWQSWEELGASLPPRDAAACALVWAVIEVWLPALWRFKV